MRRYSDLAHDASERGTLPNGELEWLRKKQNVVFPILPITNDEARKRFYRWIPDFLRTSRSMTDMYLQMAIQWNHQADGKSFFYITVDLLKVFVKRWEKIQNIKASEALAKADGFDLRPPPNVTQDVPNDFVMDLDGVVFEPNEGFVDTTGFYDPTLALESLPQLSTVTQLPASVPIAVQIVPVARTTSDPPTAQQALPSIRTDPTTYSVALASDQRTRVLDPSQRKSKQRTCRRCKDPTCCGSSNITRCPHKPRVPCVKCGKLEECVSGADGGRKCMNK
jgi:hypothetical protein